MAYRKFKVIDGGNRAYRRRRPPPLSPPRRSLAAYRPLWLAAVLVGLIVGTNPSWWPGAPPPPASVAGGQAVRFGLCVWGGGTNCVVDGDTFYLDGAKIRIAGIDAPETHDYRCASEKALGDQSTARLHALLQGGPLTLTSIDRDRDVYGRLLRNVAVNGADVGDTLVAEGLARPYGNGRRSWC